MIRPSSAIAVVTCALVACAPTGAEDADDRRAPIAPDALLACLVAADGYIEAIGDLTGADTLSGALSSVGEAFDACSAARTSLEAVPDLLGLPDDDRAHLLEPLVDLLDTMSLQKIVLAIGVADPTVFDAGSAGADGFRRPIEQLADALRQRWGHSSRIPPSAAHQSNTS